MIIPCKGIIQCLSQFEWFLLDSLILVTKFKTLKTLLVVFTPPAPPLAAPQKNLLRVFTKNCVKNLVTLFSISYHYEISDQLLPKHPPNHVSAITHSVWKLQTYTLLPWQCTFDSMLKGQAFHALDSFNMIIHTELHNSAVHTSRQCVITHSLLPSPHALNALVYFISKTKGDTDDVLTLMMYLRTLICNVLFFLNHLWQASHSLLAEML